MQEDGSFMAEVPADTPLGFEALRPARAGPAPRRTVVWVRAGENRSCTGCHAAHNRAPHNHRPLAVYATVPCLRMEHGAEPGPDKRREMKPSGILIRVGILVLWPRSLSWAIALVARPMSAEGSASRRWPRQPVSTAISCPLTGCSGPSHGRITTRPPAWSSATTARDSILRWTTVTKWRRRILPLARYCAGPGSRVDLIGLALDASGKRLFVTCRQADRLALLDIEMLNETGSLPVGMGPTAVAFCRTAAGDRLIVANAMSDDISVISLAPLKELARPRRAASLLRLRPRPTAHARSWRIVLLV